MYTNVPKSLALPPKMIADMATDNMLAEYYEKKYLGSDTVAQLNKDTYTKADSPIINGTDAPVENKKPSLKEKIKNIWNGGGSKVAKGLGLAASILLLLKGKKSLPFLKDVGSKIVSAAKKLPSKIAGLIKKTPKAAQNVKDTAIKALPAAPKLLGLPAPKV